MKRSNVVPRVSRKMKDNVKVMTIYGKETVQTCHCNTCEKNKHINDFYIDNRTGKVRNQCIECWDRYKGRTKPDYQPTNTLYNEMENMNDRLPMGREIQTKDSQRRNPARKFKRHLL